MLLSEIDGDEDEGGPRRREGRVRVTAAARAAHCARPAHACSKSVDHVHWSSNHLSLHRYPPNCQVVLLSRRAPACVLSSLLHILGALTTNLYRAKPLVSLVFFPCLPTTIFEARLSHLGQKYSYTSNSECNIGEPQINIPSLSLTDIVDAELSNHGGSYPHLYTVNLPKASR